MDAADLLKKVRHIEIKTKGLSKHIFSGDYQSAFKGRGMSFSEVREYQYGDDVRNIDWNVTARTGDPHVKIHEEERELTLMLLIDQSNSSLFGTQKRYKNEIIAEIAAVLSFSAISNSDKVGAILFSNRIDKFIAPKKGRKHILHIVRELVDDNKKSQGTDLKKALEYLNNLQKRRAIVFIISDFLCDDYMDDLKLAAKRHDIIGIRVFDHREVELPNVGLLQVIDSETNIKKTIDTSSSYVRAQYAKWQKEKMDQLKNAFVGTNSDLIHIQTEDDYVKSLIKFFKRRIG